MKQLERAGVADLIVLDAPAAGHAITFLRSARGLLDAARVGPINTQAAEVLEMLTDPERCQVVLVTLPEETPVNELVDTAYSLEDEVGREPRPGGGERPLPDRSTASTATPQRLAAAAGLTVDPAELDGHGRARPGSGPTAPRLQAEQIARLGRRAAAAPAHPAVPLLVRPRARPTSTTSTAAAVAGIDALDALPDR